MNEILRESILKMTLLWHHFPIYFEFVLLSFVPEPIFGCELIFFFFGLILSENFSLAILSIKLKINLSTQTMKQRTNFHMNGIQLTAKEWNKWIGKMRKLNGVSKSEEILEKSNPH